MGIGIMRWRLTAEPEHERPIDYGRIAWVENTWEGESYTLFEIHYQNATNFGGKKYCLYKNEDVFCSRPLEYDPHFSENGKGPVARFPPTPEGLRMAKILMETMK